jgi:hypothetical protein
VAAIEVLDPSAVRRWCTGAVAALEAARTEIDGLNVYPVPDGACSTNLLLTLRVADSAVDRPPGDLAATLSSMARGAVLGAGSSVILKVLRGLAESAGRADRAALARRWPGRRAGLGAVAERSRTCCRWSARRPGRRRRRRLAAVARAPPTRTAHALDRTPTSCRCWPGPAWSTPAARGLCVLLGAGHGRRQEAGAAAEARSPPGDGARDRPDARLRGAVPARHLDTSGRAELAELGDSLVVVGTARHWTVHVHVNDIGGAIEAGVQQPPVPDHRDPVRRRAAGPPGGHRVVAVAPGASRLFAAEGAARRRHRGRGAGGGAAAGTGAAGGRAERPRPRTPPPRAGRRRRGRRGADPVAVQGSRGGGARRGRRFGDDVIAMAEAAAAARWGEVFLATGTR